MKVFLQLNCVIEGLRERRGRDYLPLFQEKEMKREIKRNKSLKIKINHCIESARFPYVFIVGITIFDHGVLFA